MKHPEIQTTEEIKKLAEECSLYYQGRPAKRGYELSTRLTIESYALMTLKWLSNDYLIVPKSKILEEYDFNHTAGIGEAIRTGDMTNKYILKRDLLETLFGKSLFNEEKG